MFPELQTLDFMMIRRVRGLFMVFLRDGGGAGFTRSVLCNAIESHSALRVGLFTAETQRRKVAQRIQDAEFQTLPTVYNRGLCFRTFNHYIKTCTPNFK
jgi:hypothetical protein